MDLHTVETIAFAIAMIVFVTVRQCLWQSVNLRRLLRMPVVFAALGVVSLVSSVQAGGPGLHVGLVDVAVIGTELGLGLAAGVLMGRSTEIRTVAGSLQSRLVGLGVVVWLGFLGVRIGLAVLAHALNAGLAEQTGTVLLTVAVIKTVQAVLIRERIDRHRAQARHEQHERSYATLGL